MAQYLLQADQVAALRTAWPDLPHVNAIDGAGIVLADDNTLLELELYCEDDTQCFDHTVNVTDIPAESQRALVAIALTFGQQFGEDWAP